MSDERDLRAKREVLAVLRRGGIPEHTVQALNAALEDPVDLRRDRDLLARYGITTPRFGLSRRFTIVVAGFIPPPS
jgi:hypothetical protein